MKVSTETSKATVRRVARITEGHPTIAMAYARPPKTVVVDHVEIEYTWKNGAWVVDSVLSVGISGVVLKKDGEPSKNRHSRRAPSTGGYDKEAPAPWLDAIIDLLRPHGDLSMTVLRDAEVDW